MKEEIIMGSIGANRNTSTTTVQTTPEPTPVAVTKQSIPKSQVEIEDSEFRAYNGNGPAGFGNWGFDMDGDEIFFTGKYSAAKRQAIEEAARRGVRRVKLLT